MTIHILLVLAVFIAIAVFYDRLLRARYRIPKSKQHGRLGYVGRVENETWIEPYQIIAHNKPASAMQPGEMGYTQYWCVRFPDIEIYTEPCGTAETLVIMTEGGLKIFKYAPLDPDLVRYLIEANIYTKYMESRGNEQTLVLLDSVAYQRRVNN